jgi:ADP-ribose pyrophosphatase YjhB (NUDIX family)
MQSHFVQRRNWKNLTDVAPTCQHPASPPADAGQRGIAYVRALCSKEQFSGTTAQISIALLLLTLSTFGIVVHSFAFVTYTKVQHMRHTSDHVAIDHLALALLRHGDNLVLVQQQNPDDPEPYWVLPGGLVEGGELVMDALNQEVQEEAGVQVVSIRHLACLTQIDRPYYRAQTITFIFEVETWHGSVRSNDPDAEVIRAELVPLAEAINRLQRNGAWLGIQEPLLAYLHNDVGAGAVWFYREDADKQHLIACLCQ